MAQWGVFPDGKAPAPAVVSLAEQVERDGGQALADLSASRSAGTGRSSACCPLGKVEPTPYQRDLSPTHAKRLQEVVKKIDRFVDPIVVVSPKPGVYWTPNGHHRRAVLEKLKAEMVPAILVPEPEVAFQILALNTEKAHNLKEKSLEVIRMYRGLAEEEPRTRRGGLRVPVRGAALHHARAALRGRTSASRAAPSRRSCGAWTSS